MRCAWLALAATVAAGGAMAAEKAVSVPPSRLELSDPRTAALLDLLGTELAESQMAELRSLSRDDPSRDVRLAATWVLGHKKNDGVGPENPYEVEPRMVKKAAPAYPKDARRQRIQGTVLVEFLIDDEGRVAHAEVRESIPALDAAALATIRKWRFAPGRIAGKAVATVAQAPVAFRLLDEAR